MKKFYALALLTLCSFSYGFAQTWTGGAGNGFWNDAGNWSGGVPTSSGDVIFSGGAVINVTLNVTTSIRSLTVSGAGTTVHIVGTGVEELTATSTNTLIPTLKVDAGTVLRLDQIVFNLPTGAAGGSINGRLTLEGNSDADVTLLNFPDLPLASLFVIGSGGQLAAEFSNISIVGQATANYLRFASGSTFELLNGTASIPAADYDPASTINVLGITGDLAVSETTVLGNIIWNDPTQAGQVDFGAVANSTLTMSSFTVLNTNNKLLVLAKESVLNITGNLSISGNSRFALADTPDGNLLKTFDVTVGGNLNAGGTNFSMQSSDKTGLGTTTLHVKGDIFHTAGTFAPDANYSDNTKDIYVIDMNGTVHQAISSSSGTFDKNGQVTLRINNASDVSLSSALTVGRLKFASGRLSTTPSNVLTISNTANTSVILSGVTASSYVNGPLQRTTAGTAAVLFPVGNGSDYRRVTMIPASSASSVYRAEYIGAPLNQSSVLSPVRGVVAYYWNIAKVSGADAVVELTLPATIAEADALDNLLAVMYNGSAWADARGTTGNVAPGTSAAGTTLRTGSMSSFGSITVGYALQAALPIDLESFTAKKSANAVELSWRVSDNSTPASFEIMKSGDGVEFAKIGSVTGMEGKTSYFFTDSKLNSSNSYYRLRMLDKDGSVKLSNIVVVMNGTNGVIISSMIPTMVIDRARLNISAAKGGNMQLVVSDISGRIVQTQNASINAGNQEIWLNASRLSPGLFQITGYLNGEKTATIRFFKR